MKLSFLPWISLCLSLAVSHCNSLVSELDRIRKKHEGTTAPGGTIQIAYPHNGRELFFVQWPHTYSPVLSAPVTACGVTPALPPGLSLDKNTCTISGTPMNSQPESDYTITATGSGMTGNAIIQLSVIAMVASRVYGQPDFVSGGAGSADTNVLASPFGIWVTSQGVYAADTSFHRVLFFNGTDTSAMNVYGQPDFFTETFPLNPNPASLKLPRAVAVDAHGKIWIADRANHRVVRYTPGQTIADGLIGQSAYSIGTSGGCTAHSFNGPDAIATDANGIYVADTIQNRVLYFPTLNPGTSLPAASRVYGQSSFVNCAANAGAIGADTLNNPSAVSVSADGVYVSDRLNNRVLFFPGTNTTATRVYGQPDFITSSATTSASGLNAPRGISVTEFGIFVADTGNNRVLFYRDQSTIADVVFGQNRSFTSNLGNLGGIGASFLSNPTGVAFRGSLYVSDMSNNRLLYY